MEIHVREAALTDVYLGLLDVHRELGEVDLCPLGAQAVLAEKRAFGCTVLVALEAAPDGKEFVVGTATVLLERKFGHGGGLAAHVEDVAVLESRQGLGVGRILVDQAVAVARAKGCYKAILNCRESLEGFYGRAGFRKHSSGMRLDLDVK